MPNHAKSCQIVTPQVRLEQLLWVMDGPLLCEAITGVEWEQYVWEMEDDEAKGFMFKKQTQLARFFEGQISLFSKMCMGRRSAPIAIAYLFISKL